MPNFESSFIQHKHSNSSFALASLKSSGSLKLNMSKVEGVIDHSAEIEGFKKK